MQLLRDRGRISLLRWPPALRHVPLAEEEGLLLPHLRGLLRRQRLRDPDDGVRDLRRLGARQVRGRRRRKVPDPQLPPRLGRVRVQVSFISGFFLLLPYFAFLCLMFSCV